MILSINMVFSITSDNFYAVYPLSDTEDKS